jgi:hypothetical protein
MFVAILLRYTQNTINASIGHYGGIPTIVKRKWDGIPFYAPFSLRVF